jgi:cytochrome c peroxidase
MYRPSLPFLLVVFAATAARADETHQPLAPLPTIVPAPEENPTTAKKVLLGRQFFFDPRLSGDNTMSCASCHLPEKSLVDGRPTAIGSAGKTLARNTPSLLNVGFLPRLFWDGRAASLEQQALGPIQSPDEMNQNLDDLEAELNAIPGYVTQFADVFGTPVSRDGIAKALAAFERSLVTGPSPLDRHLSGDKKALSPEAKRGLELFVGDAGCVRCHNGPLLSDGKLYRLGASNLDRGLGAVTGEKADNYRFRTPSLRNVARTGPYMHDGSLKSLDDVVTFYFRGVATNGPYDLPLDIEPLRHLSFSDIIAVVAFLESLNGESPQIAAPSLP